MTNRVSKGSIVPAALALALVFEGRMLASTISYTGIALGSLGGGVTQGYSINKSGQITGHSYLADEGTAHAFIYSGGSMTDLGTLGFRSEGYSINNSGQITGHYSTGGTPEHRIAASSTAEAA